MNPLCKLVCERICIRSAVKAERRRPNRLFPKPSVGWWGGGAQVPHQPGIDEGRDGSWRGLLPCLIDPLKHKACEDAHTQSCGSVDEGGNHTQATKILEPYTSSFTVQKSERSVLARPQAELVLHTPGRAGVPLITQILRTEN